MAGTFAGIVETHSLAGVNPIFLLFTNAFATVTNVGVFYLSHFHRLVISYYYCGSL